ncbi:hypothetical protein C8J56DRAFT_914394 [Mycena floridula]|nr:hypothetical protein C8J56DRAFT_914394 [Mycena floridula]
MADPLSPVQQRSEMAISAGFLEIPNEVVLLILEAVVEIEPKKAVELATLSRDLQPFFERLIYRCVSLSTYAEVTSFVDLVKFGSRPISFYQDRIKHLCIAPSDSMDIQDAVVILSACKDIQTLAIFVLISKASDTVALASFVSYIDILQPTRLAVQSEYLENPATGRLKPHCLRHVTHLELSPQITEPDMQFNDTILRYLPQLTHLSYFVECLLAEASSFASSLCLSDKLVVFIIWVAELEESISRDREYDEPRIVIGFYYGEPTDDNVLRRDISDSSIFLKDWGPRRTNELDIWELAEEIVERQRTQRPKSS